MFDCHYFFDIIIINLLVKQVKHFFVEEFLTEKILTYMTQSIKLSNQSGQYWLGLAVHTIVEGLA
jgi:hypothetical protein